MTFYGSIQKYLDGLVDFFDSIQHIKNINNKNAEEPWGYETFTVRVYVAQRNPLKETLGPLKNATESAFIKVLLNRGCEIAFVDNHLNEIGRDATFWRFLIADEPMQDQEKIRYLSRDVDHKVTAAEYFSVGEWIGSGIKYHRMHFSSCFIGPLTASVFGGTHEGKNGIKDIARLIESFPYRFVYGDDEMFSKYIIWNHMKKTRSILTHKYRRGISFHATNLYEGSPQDEPTAKYCHENEGNVEQVLDLLMPKGIKFPLVYLAYDLPLKNLPDEYFRFDKNNERIQCAINNLYGDKKPQGLFNANCNDDVEDEPALLEMYRQIRKAAKKNSR